MLDIIRTIIEAVVALLGGTALTVFLFYSAKRREAIAEAEQKEAAAEKSFAEEWQHLYELKEEKVKELDSKVDDLRKEIGVYRTQTMKLEDDMHALKLELSDANYNRCIRRNCADRIPPRKEARHESNGVSE